MPDLESVTGTGAGKMPLRFASEEIPLRRLGYLRSRLDASCQTVDMYCPSTVSFDGSAAGNKSLPALVKFCSFAMEPFRLWRAIPGFPASKITRVNLH